MKKLFALAGIVCLSAACNTSYEKTPSGLAYKIVTEGKGPKLKHNQIVKINGTVTVVPKDSILYSNYGHLPEYLPVDTSLQNTHDFTEVLKYARVGDSIVAVAQVDSLVKRGAAQYNDFLKKGDQIMYKVKVLGTFDDEEARMADQKKELDKEKEREMAEIEQYLKKNNIAAQKTENGVYVQVIDAGQEPKAQPGSQVTVNYTGSVLTSGKVFDSNIDTSFKHPEPLTFQLGAGSVIRGWDEGLKYFGKGGKGVLYIPAMMAYGPTGSGRDIPPYATLKFEVEVKDVTAPQAQPQPAQPGMPPM